MIEDLHTIENGHTIENLQPIFILFHGMAITVTSVKQIIIQFRSKQKAFYANIDIWSI